MLALGYSWRGTMALFAQLWMRLLAAAAAVGVISAAIVGLDDVRNRFWPSPNTEESAEPSINDQQPPLVATHQPREVSSPWSIATDPTTDSLARQVTDDLAVRLAVTPCTRHVITVTEPARRDLLAAQTSHGFSATYLKVGLELTAPGEVTRLVAAGSGKGPGAEIDAYSVLLENALRELRTAAPECFEGD